MLRSLSRALGWMAFGMAILGTPGAPSDAAPPDRAELRTILKQAWDSLETVLFRGEEYDLDAQGIPDRSKGFTRIDFAIGSGGRRAVVMTAVRPAGEEVVFDLHEDDRRSHGIVPAPGHPKTVDTIEVRNQINTHNRYSGPMFVALWLFTPAGRPLYAHLDDGARLEETRDSSVAGGIAMIIDRPKGGTIRCELDPEHDWLPRSVEIKGFAIMRTRRFGRDHGRWFPIEGDQTYLFKKRNGEKTGFSVTDLRINRPIPPSLFTPSAPPEGALVLDAIEGKNRIVGGPEARRRFETQYYPPRVETPTKPVVASRDAKSIPWSILLAVGSVAVLILAALRRFPRRRSEV